MGFLSNAFGQAKQLNKLANAVANITSVLDKFENDRDTSYLYISSWICKVGVKDVLERNQWSPNHIVYVPINGHQTKMTMLEVYISTVTRLMNIVADCCDNELQNKIDNILEGGAAFYEIDAQVPPEIKKLIE